MTIWLMLYLVRFDSSLNPGSGAKAITSAQSDKPVTLR
jgi:hypothetical protein